MLFLEVNRAWLDSYRVAHNVVLEAEITIRGLTHKRRTKRFSKKTVVLHIYNYTHCPKDPQLTPISLLIQRDLLLR